MGWRGTTVANVVRKGVGKGQFQAQGTAAVKGESPEAGEAC